jgi:AraC family transcriptional regulator
VSISNVFSPVMRAGTLLGGSPSEPQPEATLAAHGLQGWQEPADAERMSLERLQIAVAELFKALSNALEDERESAEQCMQRASAILGVDLRGAIASVAAPLTSAAPPKPIRGGLAPWQVRRVKTHIETNLGAAITTKDLATLARLSSYHFCRTFRNSFGESPRGYVTRRRVERAQGLMLTTNTSLGQIAADCGFTDQAHLSRLFRRFVGETPSVWRRARAIESAWSANNCRSATSCR